MAFEQRRRHREALSGTARVDPCSVGPQNVDIKRRSYSQRVNVVRTVYAEADGKPLPDPDPADPGKNQFAWMTAIDFKPDREVAYPFTGWGGLVPADK